MSGARCKNHSNAKTKQEQESQTFSSTGKIIGILFIHMYDQYLPYTFYTVLEIFTEVDCADKQVIRCIIRHNIAQIVISHKS